MADGLQFRGNNPGAVQYGNFINYYQFNAPENRLEVFPTAVLDQIKSESAEVYCLDVGCNSGDLTLKLQEVLKNTLKKNCFILGVDIDDTLIRRAQEKSNPETQFLTLDFTNQAERELTLQKYMAEKDIKHFDITFCFSITMWIHLNHGDTGLENFLSKICKISKLVFVEPQNWGSYKTAVKRLKQAGEQFPHFQEIKFKKNIELDIERIFLKYSAKKIHETPRTKFKRKLLAFKTNTSS